MCKSLTDIAGELAEQLAEQLADLLIKKVKVARSRRAPRRAPVNFSSGVFLVHKMVIEDICKVKGSA